jgi:hypothetical protein
MESHCEELESLADQVEKQAVSEPFEILSRVCACNGIIHVITGVYFSTG